MAYKINQNLQGGKPMFKLQDGREHLWQWDSNRKVIVNDPNIKQVHFSNYVDPVAYVVEVKNGLADIPNILLQDIFNIVCYGYIDEYTKVEQTFTVTPRNKPTDYVYTETEIRSYEYLEKKLDEIEKQGFSEETVAKAVQHYFELYPVELKVVDDGNGNVNMSIDMIPNAEENEF